MAETIQCYPSCLDSAVAPLYSVFELRFSKNKTKQNKETGAQCNNPPVFLQLPAGFPTSPN